MDEEYIRAVKALFTTPEEERKEQTTTQETGKDMEKRKDKESSPAVLTSTWKSTPQCVKMAP